MKVAIVHDWVIGQGGAERVLAALLDLYPQAHLFTLLYDKAFLDKLPTQPQHLTSSFLQKMPLAKSWYRHFLPLFPKAIESFDVSGFDLVLSSSHAVAKGIKTHANQLHICYCHTPMRYAWDLYDQYIHQLTGIKKTLAAMTLRKMKEWDLKTVGSVDHFIANSRHIQERILANYLRTSTVIYPPVNTEGFERVRKEDFYLTISRLVPYKRVDVIVDAFTKMADKKLVIIGSGPEEERLKERAGPLIEFLSFQPDTIVRHYLARARGFVFAAEEDFGIVPVEAQAAGTPVIGFGKGGILETVVPGKTGVFFETQTPLSLIDAIYRFEHGTFSQEEIRAQAEQFHSSRFKKEMSQFIEEKWFEFSQKP